MTRIAGTHIFVDGNNVMGSRPDGWWRVLQLRGASSPSWNRTLAAVAASG